MRIKTLIIVALALTISACEVKDGLDGMNSLMKTQVETAGANCEAGGIKLMSGLDTNRNNILDDIEVQNENYICNGDSGNLVLDNLVRITVGSPDFQSCLTTDWAMTPYESHQLHDFNKLDYENVTSIIFVASLATFEVENTMYAELYNITDNVPIANSQVSMSGSEGVYKYKYTQNIYDALPNYPITLSIRIRGEMESVCVQTGTYSYLYILRE